MAAELAPTLPESWRVRRLDEVATIIDSLHKTPSYSDIGSPMVRVTEVQGGFLDLSKTLRVSEEVFQEFTRRYAPKKGDMVFSRVGSYGNVSYARTDTPFCLGQNTALISPRINGRFLHLFLQSAAARWQIEQVVVGSTQKTISLKSISALQIPIPPPDELETIAAVLGALDDKIELNRRMNATLEAMARALFQSWFIDFDPVRRNMDRNQPSTRPSGHPSPSGRRVGDEGAAGLLDTSPPAGLSVEALAKAGLDPAIDALFPEHFEHGEHGMLPVGWRQTAIEEVCAINAWTLGKNADLETLEYIEISEVNRGNIANIATYTRGEEPSRARRRLSHGDTILSTVRPDRGSYFLALNPPKNRVASTGFAVLTPKKAPWSFIHAAMTQQEVSDHLGQMADGGAYPAVSPEIIGAMKVCVPQEPKILEAFHCTCAPFFEQAEANRSQSLTLATLRDALLPKLLSVELSVAERNSGS